MFHLSKVLREFVHLIKMDAESDGLCRPFLLPSHPRQMENSERLAALNWPTKTLYMTATHRPFSYEDKETES